MTREQLYRKIISHLRKWFIIKKVKIGNEYNLEVDGVMLYPIIPFIINPQAVDNKKIRGKVIDTILRMSHAIEEHTIVCYELGYNDWLELFHNHYYNGIDYKSNAVLVNTSDDVIAFHWAEAEKTIKVIIDCRKPEYIILNKNKKLHKNIKYNELRKLIYGYEKD